MSFWIIIAGAYLLITNRAPWIGLALIIAGCTS